MKRAVLCVIAAAVIAGGGGAYYWKTRSAAANGTGEEIKSAAVMRGPLRQTVQCTGRVVSNLDVEIKCKASGLVVKLPYDVSDPVKQGDLLLEIDPVDQLRAVQQCEAALAASQARLSQSKANLAVAEQNLVVEKQRAAASVTSAQARVKDANAKAKREQDLLARKQSTVEQAETADTTAIEAKQNLHTAEAQMESIKALELQLEVRRQDIALAQADVDTDTIALSLANQRLSETKVMAPIDGVVSARNVQTGQIIASGINNVGGGTTVLTVSDLSRIFVLASVDESDIGNVTLDQRVNITADAYRSRNFTGKVVRIAAKGVNVSNVVTFEVRIEVLSDNKALLKPEMTANIEIVVAENEYALIVPLRAVYRKDRGKTFVKVRKPDRSIQEDVPVETGINSGSDIEIKTGLQENETVLFQNTEEESQWRNSSTSPRVRGGLLMPGPTMRGRR